MISIVTCIVILLVTANVTFLDAFSVQNNSFLRLTTHAHDYYHGGSSSHQVSYNRVHHSSPLLSSIYANTEAHQDLEKSKGPVKISLSAIRASIRATTGFSLTATRTALRTMTGVSVTSIVKAIVGVFKPWMRYFFQPFLILYYVPLTSMKYFVGTTKTSRAEQLAAHEKLVEGWKDAIREAEGKLNGEFPLHVSDDGTIETKMNMQREDISECIVSAIEQRYEEDSTAA
jgi:hypothetical protein